MLVELRVLQRLLAMDLLGCQTPLNKQQHLWALICRGGSFQGRTLQHTMNGPTNYFKLTTIFSKM